MEGDVTAGSRRLGWRPRLREQRGWMPSCAIIRAGGLPKLVRTVVVGRRVSGMMASVRGLLAPKEVFRCGL